MTYPPPPSNAFLAYQFGSITKDELINMLELWYKKHQKPPEEGKRE